MQAQADRVRAGGGVDAELDAVGALRVERRIAGEQPAEARGIEFVQVRRAEALAHGQEGARGLAPAPAARELARGRAAEGRVVVVARGRLPVEGAAAALRGGEQAEVAARLAVGAAAARGVERLAALAHPVQAEHQAGVGAERQVAGPVEAAAPRAEGGGEGRRVERLAVEAQHEALAERRRQRALDGEAGHVGVDHGLAAVELDVGAGGVGLQRHALPAQRGVATQAEVAVAVTVSVGIVGEPARPLRREAVEVDAAGDRAEAGRVVARAPGRLRLAAVPAPQRQPRVGAARVAGEHLHHAADRVRAVPRGARAAHDLDPLDLAEREVLPGEAAGVGRRHADAVDEHKRLVGVGAAQEDRRLLAFAAGAGDIDARHAAQQGGQVGRVAARDVLAGDHGDRGQGVVHRLRAAGGGDDDLGLPRRFGDGIRCGAQRRAQQEGTHRWSSSQRTPARLAGACGGASAAGARGRGLGRRANPSAAAHRSANRPAPRREAAARSAGRSPDSSVAPRGAPSPAFPRSRAVAGWATSCRLTVAGAAPDSHRLPVSPASRGCRHLPMAGL